MVGPIVDILDLHVLPCATDTICAPPPPVQLTLGDAQPGVELANILPNECCPVAYVPQFR